MDVAGQWTDVTDGVATHDGSSAITLIDKHVYRPTSANAWVGTDVTLPDKASVTVRPSTVANFAGNTYTLLTIIGGGDLTLYGASGVVETITALVKNGPGTLKIQDETAGGLRISGWTANGSAKVADIVINTSGSNTTLNLAAALDPPAGQSPLTVNIDSQAIITLMTLPTIPKLTGSGRIIMTNIAAITTAELGRLSGFKGILQTRSGGVTDVGVTSTETSIWTLSGAVEVKWADLLKMKGTVRLPAGTRINFVNNSSA